MTMPTGSSAPTRRRTLVAVAIAVVIVLAVASTLALLWWKLGRPHDASVVDATFVEYPMPVPTDIPTAVAVAGDGSVWFSIDFSDAVGVVRGGKVERFPKGSRSSEPIGIAVDTKGRAWVTDAARIAILGVSSTGEVNAVKLGTPIARLGRMAAAPDGSVWFAESTSDSITRLADGELKRHPTDSSRGGPFGVAVAADGTVWASLQGANSLLRIAPDGTTSEHEIPTPGVVPTDIAVDRSGVVWFIEFRTDRIGRYVGGGFDAIAAPHAKAGLTGLAVAPDGAVWFGMLRKASLGRLRDGRIVEFKLPRPDARPFSLAVDGAGNVWYADIGGFVGMLPAAQASR
jgi:virginiamycin B lyase